MLHLNCSQELEWCKRTINWLLLNFKCQMLLNVRKQSMTWLTITCVTKPATTVTSWRLLSLVKVLIQSSCHLTMWCVIWNMWANSMPHLAVTLSRQIWLLWLHTHSYTVTVFLILDWSWCGYSDVTIDAGTSLWIQYHRFEYVDVALNTVTPHLIYIHSDFDVNTVT